MVTVIVKIKVKKKKPTLIIKKNHNIDKIDIKR